VQLWAILTRPTDARTLLLTMNPTTIFQHLPLLAIRRLPTRWVWMCLAAAALLVAATGVARAATSGPASTAASQRSVAGADCTTPLGMLRKSDALNGAEPEAFAQFYEAASDDERRMARTEARFDAEFGLLQVLVEKKWGKDAGDAITHAMGGETIPDAEAARLTITGDRATLAWKDNSAPLHLIKVGGVWKIDLAATIAALDITPEQYVQGFHKMSALVADFAESIDAGKLKTLEQAVADAKRRTMLVSQGDD
jgi:hypothetical protein